MKKLFCMLLAAVILLSLAGCAKAPAAADEVPAVADETPDWQSQYDLGVRYLSEGKYEEAILAFTAAIEIDPKRAEAFLGRGEAYEKQGDLERAAADYQAAVELEPNADAEEKLKKWEEERLTAQLQEELWPMVCDLELPMTVDSVVLGETSIETAKSIYASYPYAKSNLMNDDTLDTVYNCFGMDMPIPDGYEADEFGFLFSAPVGGAVDEIVLNQPGFVAFGAFQVGDAAEMALELFGFPETLPCVPLQWSLNNGAQLEYKWYGDDDFSFIYQLDGQRARVYAEGGVVHYVELSAEGEMK